MQYYERPQDLARATGVELPQRHLETLYDAYTQAFAEGKSDREGWQFAWSAIEEVLPDSLG